MTFKVKILTPQNFLRNKPMSHCKGQKCSFNWYGTSKPRSIASINHPLLHPPHFAQCNNIGASIFLNKQYILGLYILHIVLDRESIELYVFLMVHTSPFYNMRVNTLNKKIHKKPYFFI